MDSDGPPVLETQTTATPKGVSFAQPLASYREDLDDLIDVSSSSQDSDHDATFGSGIYTQQEPGENERGLCRSSYLERLDYKALLQSLRANEQHNTANHLMSVVMLKNLPTPELRQITQKRLRKGWTAWPLSPSHTKHSHQAQRQLVDQLQATLHRQIGHRLVEAGKIVSSDDLPDDVCQIATDMMLDKLSLLLKVIGKARAMQGGEAKSSNRRLGLLTSDDVLRLLSRGNIISKDNFEHLDARCRALFGTQFKTAKPIRTEAPDWSIPYEEGHELSVGSGRWHLRGSKRRRIILDETSAEVRDPPKVSIPITGDAVVTHAENVDDDAIVPRAMSQRRAYTVARDGGARYSASVQPVPRRFIKDEQD